MTIITVFAWSNEKVCMQTVLINSWQIQQIKIHQKNIFQNSKTSFENKLRKIFLFFHLWIHSKIIFIAFFKRKKTESEINRTVGCKIYHSWQLLHGINFFIQKKERKKNVAYNSEENKYTDHRELFSLFAWTGWWCLLWKQGDRVDHKRFENMRENMHIAIDNISFAT